MLIFFFLKLTGTRKQGHRFVSSLDDDITRAEDTEQHTAFVRVVAKWRHWLHALEPILDFNKILAYQESGAQSTQLWHKSQVYWEQNHKKDNGTDTSYGTS